MRVLFIWDTLDIASRIAHHYARHAVHFQLFSEAPYAAGHLALVLLRLTDNASRDAAYNSVRPPKLRDLTYSIAPSGVYGTAYFSGFERAYADASAFSAANAYFTFTPSPNHTLPLTTWPEHKRDLADPDIVHDCYATVQ